MAVTMPGEAATDDVVAEGAPATNVTVAVGARAPIVAVTVFPCATVEDIVAVNTPDMLVLPEICVKVLLAPVLLKVTP